MLNHSEDDAANTFLALFLNSSSYGLWKYAEFQDDGKQSGFELPIACTRVHAQAHAHTPRDHRPAAVHTVHKVTSGERHSLLFTCEREKCWLPGGLNKHTRLCRSGFKGGS